MAVKLYSDIFVLLTIFKWSADRLWLETPPQTFMQGRYNLLDTTFGNCNALIDKKNTIYVRSDR